jgi:1-phosphofructokinase
VTTSAPRIWAVTLNPAIDDCRLERSGIVSLGGGGINAARSIGGRTVATGFAGASDLPLFGELGIHGVDTRFVPVAGSTRLLVFDPGKGGKAQRTLGRPGFEVTRGDLERLIAVLTDPATGVKRQDVVILSGSVPKPLNGDTYAILAKSISDSGARIVLDGPAEEVRRAVPTAWILKQNRREFERLTGRADQSDDDLFDLCRSVFPRGITLVTLGSAGTFVGYRKGELYRGFHLHCDLPWGLPTVSSLGTGDVITGQFAWEISLSGDVISAATWAVAAATASLANPFPGVFDPILAGEVRSNIRYSYERSVPLGV